MAPPLQTFGKYQILERIAMGGTAEIYKARLEGIGGFQRTFAIKRILPSLSDDSDYIAMLVDEAKVAGLLSHANIVQILDLGQVDNVWYIAMEYVHGRDLRAVLRRARKKGLSLPVPHSVFVALELLKALEYAHNRHVPRQGRPVALNIIHRDVSPPNVLLSFQGEVKLTDFGIARASLEAIEPARGIVRGRFDYMSPEQAEGAKDLDQRSDLFSVGVVLYETLAGHHPFRADTEVGTIDRVRTGRFVPVRQRNAEVPPALEAIVDRALQVDRNDRYPSATAFKEALDRFFHDAGFLFSHATLAAYVRGLFPDMVRPDPALGGASEPGATPAPIGAVKVASRSTSAERPTRQFDRKMLAGVHRRPTALDDLTRGTITPRRPPVAGRPGGNIFDGPDQETLLRGMPEGWDLDDPNAADATRLRPLPVPEGPESRPAAPPEQAARARQTETPRLLPPRPQPAPTSPILQERVARGSTLGWFALWLSGFTFVLGAFVGAVPFLGAVLFDRLKDATLTVVAPTGAHIEIDGAVAGSETELVPGVEHAVTVVLEDGALPYRTTVKLDRGETRVIVVSAAETVAPK